MKNLILTMLFTLCAICTYGQEEKIQPLPKPTVFISETTNRDYNSKEVSAIRNAIVNVIISSGRIIAIDAASEEIAKREDIRRTNENTSAGGECFTERMGIVEKLGAQQYLKISVDDISYSEGKSLGGNPFANCTLVASLQLYNPSNATLIKSQQIKFTGTSTDTNRDKAYQNMLTSISSNAKVTISQNPLLQAIEDLFPLIAQIIEIDQAKKNEAKTVYINAGSDSGVQQGIIMEVFTEKKVASRTAQIEIGEIKVESIQAGDLALCKVSKGGDKIFSAFNEGAVLKVISRPKKTFIKL